MLLSNKKEGWYNPVKGIVEPPINITIEKHKPDRITELNEIANEN